jgi:hypothetical protein
MKYDVRSHQGKQKLPATQIFSLLDDQLLVFVRSWGSQDYNQKFIDEISHFLSTAQADIEVTSPFDYVEHLTSLSNKVRISLLLAHDYFYRAENKTSFSIGFESAILMRYKNEVAWGSVGRFNIDVLENSEMRLISALGSDLDPTALLPIGLIGVERDIDIRSGSISTKNNSILISSTYDSELKFISDQSENQIDQVHEVTSEKSGTYWFSKVTLD